MEISCSSRRLEDSSPGLAEEDVVEHPGREPHGPDPVELAPLALPDAVALFTRASAAAPGDTNVLLQLAGALAERDDLEPARRIYADARRHRPHLLRAAFGEALTLPMEKWSDIALVS